jgi:FkbM family methyltransferase
VLSTPLGRRAFEAGYWAYKTYWERELTAIRALVTPGSCAVDVGANVGFFTLKFARWVGEFGRVVAVEPAPDNLATLRRRISERGLQTRVHCEAAVAAEAEGQLFLYLNPDNPADHRIGREGIATRAVTLDALLERLRWPPVSLVKVDVQGAELRVLKGAAGMIARDKPALLIEMDDSALRRFGASAEDVSAFLEAFGYRAFVPTDVRGETPLSPEMTRKLRAALGYADILFLAVPPRPL